MTRFIYDQFSKDYLDELLSPYGEVNASRSIVSEIQEIDLCFSPSTNQLPNELGLLGKLANQFCLFEPYRNPVTPSQIRACLGKLVAVEGKMIREFKRNQQSFTEANVPYLWVLTPTASKRIIQGVKGEIISELGEGVYLSGEVFKTGLVVIHQLPVTPETLLLRLLGRGKVQSNAITEVESLSEDNPLKSIILEALHHCGMIYNKGENLNSPIAMNKHENQLS